jgi:pimeloyl-ACP methyl ester carboxylesterase
MVAVAALVAAAVLAVPAVAGADTGPATSPARSSRPIVAPSASSDGWGDPGWSPSYGATLARFAAQPVAWAPCFDDGSAPGFDCASIAAPLDWSNPATGTIHVRVSRLRATGTRIGILQTNPGGPGGAGSWVPLFLQEADPAIADHYDLVGMDTRGSAESDELGCGGVGTLTRWYRLDGTDHSTLNASRFVTGDLREAALCGADAMAPYVNTDQTARDVDLVRSILGEQRTGWVGYSAGAWLGAWYATLFPSHVGRFLFDGSPDFTTDWYSNLRSQPAAFQRRFEEDLIPWLARYDDLLHLGATPEQVRATYQRRRDALASHPMALADGSRLDGVTYDAGIASALYASSHFPDLGQAMSVIERYATATPADRALVAQLFPPIEPEQAEHVFWTVVCNDTAKPSVGEVAGDWATLGRTFPLVGSTLFADPCPFWKLPPIGSPVTGRGIPPLLMIQNDGDPATPYAGGLAAHRHTPSSVLVTVRHDGDHTIFGTGDACVDDIANAWLLLGILPAADRSCEGIPLPDLAALTAGGSAPATTAPSVVPAMSSAASTSFAAPARRALTARRTPSPGTRTVTWRDRSFGGSTN